MEIKVEKTSEITEMQFREDVRIIRQWVQILGYIAVISIIIGILAGVVVLVG